MTRLDPIGPHPSRRREWLVVAAILVVAVAARTWRLEATAMDHYDEGVYAFSAWGLSDGARPLHPEQRNSPILHPWVTSLAFRLNGGPSDTLMLGVNALLGSLSVLALWWVARRWFGPAAAVGAAAILATNEFHIALSRSGLTDVLFSGVFLVAVAMVAAAIERPHALRAVAAGLVTGLAWNTKYHGWLAVVVVTSGLVPWAVGRRWRLADYGTAIRQLAIMTVVAMACYVPWAMYLIDVFGSYAEVSRYQLTFLSREWPANFVRQAGQQLYFDGVLTRLSLPIAMAAMACVTRGNSISGRWLLTAAGVSAVSIVAGGAPALWLATAVAIPWLMRQGQLVAWVVLAWGAILIVITPVYNPYARLVAPFVTACALAAGFVLSRWLAADTTPALRRWPSAAAAGLLGMTIVGAVLAARDSPSRWRDTRSLKDAGGGIAALVEPGASVVVIGEAALAFHLEVAGLKAFKGFEDFERLEAEAREQYVVTGYYTRVAPSLRDGLQRLGPRLTELRRFDFAPTDLRMLDSLRPEAARAMLAAPDDRYQLTLYRYTPGVPPAPAR